MDRVRILVASLFIFLPISAPASPLDCYSVFYENLTGFHRNPGLSKTATQTSLDALKRFRNSRLGVSQDDINDYPAATARRLKASNRSGRHGRALVYSQVSGILDHAAKPETESVDTEVQTLATTFRGKEEILKFIGEFEKTKGFFNYRALDVRRRFFDISHPTLQAAYDSAFYMYFLMQIHLAYTYGLLSAYLLVPVIDFAFSPGAILEFYKNEILPTGMDRFFKRVKKKIKSDKIDNREWEVHTETNRFAFYEIQKMLYTDLELDSFIVNGHELFNSYHISFLSRVFLDSLGKVKNIGSMVFTYGVSDTFFYIDPMTGEPCLTVVSRLTKKRPPSPKKFPLKNLVPKSEQAPVPVKVPG